MNTEIWKDIVGYEGYYQVSNLGVIKRLDSFVRCAHGGFKLNTGRFLKCRLRDGYPSVTLCKNGVKTSVFIHRVVAETFIQTIRGIRTLQVNHIDGNKENNSIDNLEWCTPKENTLHYHRVLGGGKHNKREVLQYDHAGNFISEYASLSYASNAVGGSPSNIYKCCVGEYKSSYGYYWRFK